MLYVYDNFVLRRAAEGRIFFVSPKMPFEYYVNCFSTEQPYFMVSQLDDGRVAIVPNVMFIPFNLLQDGFWPQNLLPTGCEYVTMKNETYPVILSSHPIANFEAWFREFESCALPFGKQTLAEFVATAPDYQPIRLRRFEEKGYAKALRKEQEFAQPLPT